MYFILYCLVTIHLLIKERRKENKINNRERRNKRQKKRVRDGRREKYWFPRGLNEVDEKIGTNYTGNTIKSIFN